MHPNKKILIFIVFAVSVGFGVYEIKSNYETAIPVPQTLPVATTPVVTNVTYFCSEGELRAAYQDTQVTLKLLDGRSFALPQVVSGSGTRYESADIVFTSKGNDAFLQEGTMTTYTNCIAGTDEVVGDISTFTDGSKVFSFAHPTDIRVSGGELGYTSTWRNNTQTLGLALAQVIIPKSVQPKTNLSDSRFTIGTSSDAQSLKECLIATNGEIAKDDITIGEASYKKFQLSDAGAGNYYDTTSYRTMRDGQCYAIEYTIHSTSIGAYSPSQGIKAFDKVSITATLESMVQSFRFL